MPLGVLSGAIGSYISRGGGSTSLGILQTANTSLGDFQIQIIQLAHALSQKKDVNLILSYLYKIRDAYLNNIIILDYLNIYPTPPYTILS